MISGRHAALCQNLGLSASAHTIPTARQRALLLLAVVAALALIASTEWMHVRLLALFSTIEVFIREHPRLGLPAFLGFGAASAMLAFVSSAVIVPAGVLVWGQAACAALLWTGWILGGIGSYALSRYVGRPAAERLGAGSAVERFATRVTRETPFGVVVLVQLALPSELPGYVLGLSRYSFWKYLAALAIAEVPYAVATVYLGSSFLQGRAVPLMLAGGALALFSASALYKLHQKVPVR
jgi:uncharacterized membrane protein YdjX (TVP38/TMEM64 family)